MGSKTRTLGAPALAFIMLFPSGRLWAAPKKARRPGSRSDPGTGSTAASSPKTAARSAEKAGSKDKKDKGRRSDVVVGETVVSAAPSSPFERTAVKMERADLDRHGSATVAEALESIPSVQAQSNARGERIITVRGFDQRQVRVLLDGVPFWIPYDGRMDLGKLGLPLLKRVQIVSGPSSLSIGPTGIGGAVLLETRRPWEAPTVEVELREREGAWMEHAALSAHRPGLGVVAMAGLARQRYWSLPRSFRPDKNEDGGRRESSDRLSLVLGMASVWQVRPSHELLLISTGELGSFGIPPSVQSTNPRYWRFSRNDYMSTSLSHKGKYGRKLTMVESAYTALFTNTLYSFDDSSYLTRSTQRSFCSTYNDMLAGGTVKGDLNLQGPRWIRNLRLRWWGEARYEMHGSEQDGEEDPPIHSTFLDLAAEAELSLPGRQRVLLQMGVTSELPGRVEGEDPKAAYGLVPLLSWGMHAGRTDITLTASRRTRFPTLRERFSEAFGRRTPNPGLGPESAWQLMSIVDSRPLSFLRARKVAFGALVDGLIEERPVGDGTMQQQNVGRAWMAGLELSVDIELPWRINGRVGYQLLWGRRLEEDSSGHEEIFGRSPHAAFIEAVYRPTRYMELSTSFRIKARTPALNPDTGRSVHLPAFTLWNLGIVLGPFEGITFFVKATNILDTLYETEPGFPDPGRQVWLGARYRR